MNAKDRIVLHLKQASVYQAHGLFAEAMKCYKEAAALVDTAGESSAKQKLTARISEQVNILKAEAAKVSALENTPNLTAVEQQVVQNAMGGPEKQSRGEAKFQVAATLMGFGQFNKALSEFDALLHQSEYRVSAAKNILRCQIAVGSSELAVRQYNQWLENEAFSEEELDTIRIFLEGILRRKGSQERLARRSAKPAEEASFPEEEEVFDVMAVVLPDVCKTRPQTPPVFDVTSQSADFVSLIVPASEKELVANLKPGARLERVSFYTPEAFFFDDCVVSSRLRIDEGRRFGDFSVTLKLLRT
jgi:tetratricopeptide (TPR) repeat protein